MNKNFILSIACLLLFSCFEDVDNTMQKEIDSMNAITPIQVDEITFLQSAYMSGDNITFKYSVFTEGDDDFFKGEDFHSLQRAALVNLYCFSEDTQLFREYNKILTYSYYSDFGRFLTDITVFPTDCN